MNMLGRGTATAGETEGGIGSRFLGGRRIFGEKDNRRRVPRGSGGAQRGCEDGAARVVSELAILRQLNDWD